MSNLRFAIVLTALILGAGIWDTANADLALYQQEQTAETLAERERVERAKPRRPIVLPTTSTTTTSTMTTTTTTTMPVEIDPLADPCPGDGSDEENARCWIQHAFPENQWDTALAVAWGESNWRPDICFGFHHRDDPECDPERHRMQVSGLFQHRNKFWEDRSANTLRVMGIENRVLDRWDGWHNTLVAEWLAGAQGWWHWAVCDTHQGPGGAGPIRCGWGGWNK